MKSNLNGILYLVATPIGNLEDITFRAVNTLNAVDLIIAEDTRVTANLLNHLNIKKPLYSFHNHNEAEKQQEILHRLNSGENIALVSDAGTPLIADPGFRLVKECHKQGIKVTPIVGACALIAGLSASGLPCENFCFEGFLPSKTNARTAKLISLKDEIRTMVFYETKHRISEALEDIVKIFGENRAVTLARELTKTFETIIHSTAKELLIEITNKPIKGEIVLIVKGKEKKVEEISSKELELLQELILHLPVKKAVQIVTNTFEGNKNALYQKALEFKTSDSV